MIKVLFICHGNICRSPMAEFVFKDMIEKKHLSERFFIASAAAHTDEIGNPPHPGTQAILRREGISCKGKRARLICQEDYEEFDYLIGMDEYNIRDMRRKWGKEEKIYLLLDFAGIHRSVADPWYTGDFETTYQDVLLGCKSLLHYLQECDNI